MRIKTFFGYSENAVKTQIWIAISIYVLVAIMKMRLGLDQSLYTTANSRVDIDFTGCAAGIIGVTVHSGRNL